MTEYVIALPIEFKVRVEARSPEDALDAAEELVKLSIAKRIGVSIQEIHEGEIIDETPIGRSNHKEKD